jgi:hypothetical protein
MREKRKKNGIGGENAYMTVEAALVLPIVFAVQLLAVYLFIFQYDRCLLDQDVGRLSVLGCRAEAGDKDELTDSLKKAASEVYYEKYLAWNMESLTVELVKENVCVEGSGALKFPVPGWQLWDGETRWTASAVSEYQRLQPVFLIRQYKKLKGSSSPTVSGEEQAKEAL